ncbi:MAG: GNAT family protein [Planctomycetota bacterium]
MRPTAVTLHGRSVRLEPLGPEHAAGLFVAAEPSTFRFMPAQPSPWDLGGFLIYIRRLLALEHTNCYAVASVADNHLLGVTCEMDIRSEHRGLEIGNTWLAPEVRGTAINPEMKRLLLARAFETPLFGAAHGAHDPATGPPGPAIRVQLKTDERNTPSQRAMERLGFTREGVLRRHMIVGDGVQRNSVMYSVIAEEWPRVRDTIDARLAELQR